MAEEALVSVIKDRGISSTFAKTSVVEYNLAERLGLKQPELMFLERGIEFCLWECNHYSLMQQQEKQRTRKDEATNIDLMSMVDSEIADTVSNRRLREWKPLSSVEDYSKATEIE